LTQIFFFLGEDIDSETLFNLPQFMINDLIKPMKERVRFLLEHRNLFHPKIRSDTDQTASEIHTHQLNNNDQ